MKELEGRTGIVTGGSSGIGYAIANTLAQAGAKVYAISRSGAVKSGMAAHLGFSEVVPYCTSKAAVCGMTRGLAVEWANDNMCVNSIAPGWFPSEMNRQVMTPERKAAILARMPVHAFGDTKDLGAMAKFLLGDGATYITGQDFAVDGGALAYGF